jgi:hypothetical protein
MGMLSFATIVAIDGTTKQVVETIICSLINHRKPPSHDSRSVFSEQPLRSVHTVIIRTQTMPSPNTLQLPP